MVSVFWPPKWGIGFDEPGDRSSSGKCNTVEILSSVGMEYPMPPLGVFFVVFGLFSLWVVSYEHIFIPCFSSENLNQSWVMLAVFGFQPSLPHCRLLSLRGGELPLPTLQWLWYHIRTSALLPNRWLTIPILVLSSFLLSCPPKRILSFLYWKTFSLSACSRTDWKITSSRNTPLINSNAFRSIPYYLLFEILYIQFRIYLTIPFVVIILRWLYLIRVITSGKKMN